MRTFMLLLAFLVNLALGLLNVSLSRGALGIAQLVVALLALAALLFRPRRPQ